jgi:ABC-type phosphate transport system substrate-binding protein
MRATRMAALIAGAVAFLGTAQAGDVAIIVHRNHPLSDVSMAELGRIFRLDQQHWKSGDKVELILQVSGSAKDELILDRVYRMKAEDLRPFWLGKVFRGELTAPPRTFASDSSVRQFVSQSLKAVGYIDSALLDDSVKALRIDGKRPGEPGYPLARAASP